MVYKRRRLLCSVQLLTDKVNELYQFREAHNIEALGRQEGVRYFVSATIARKKIKLH